MRRDGTVEKTETVALMAATIYAAI